MKRNTMKTFFDNTELKAKIKERFANQKEFSDAVCMSRQQISRRLNNKAEFTIGEIVSIASVLDIPKEDIDRYFFKRLVSVQA